MKDESNKIERRDFLKKTGTVAGVLAAGFPGIISGQTVTNAVEDRPGRLRRTRQRRGRSGADRGSPQRADRGRRHRRGDRDPGGDAAEGQREVRAAGEDRHAQSFVGLDAYDKVINSGVDVVLLATPPGFRPQHLTAAVNANKHVFCEKPCATDSPGVREVIAAQKLAQTKNLALVAGFCWRYNNMIQEAVAAGSQRRHRPAGGALLDLLHEPGEADAARERAPGRA